MSKKKDKFAAEHRSIHIVPLNPRQQELFNAIHSHPMVITVGCAGTGKTIIPTLLAAKALKKGRVDRFIITRPNVYAADQLGFDQGNELEKMSYWLREILGLLKKNMGASEVENRLKNESIQIVPLGKMRGMTLENSFVLMDEAQNTTPEQMKMFVTRIGQQARVIVNGDTGQSDIGRYSGLGAAVHIASRYGMDVPVIKFEYEHIVRSELCKQWIMNWDDYEDRCQREHRCQTSDVRGQQEEDEVINQVRDVN